MILISTLGGDQPDLPDFASVLAQYDKDHDGRLSFEEFHKDPDLGEHFGWIDTNDDKMVPAEEWNYARSMSIGDEYGAVGLRPGDAKGELKAEAVRWRVKKSLPYIPAPLVYRDVYYMVKTGGIITALNPSTGEILKQGRTREAPGEYYASPVTSRWKDIPLQRRGQNHRSKSR